MLKFNQAKKVMESVKFVFVANGKKFKITTNINNIRFPE